MQRWQRWIGRPPTGIGPPRPGEGATKPALAVAVGGRRLRGETYWTRQDIRYRF